jgi:LPS-assembly lipoprotein
MSGRAFTSAALLAAALALTGCTTSGSGGGFRPLYAGGASGPVATNLAAVSVVALEGRVGQQVRNELIFFFTGGAEAPPAKYVLEITVIEGSQAAAVDPFSGRPEVVSLTLTTNFKLRAAGAGPSATPLFSGSTFARASYTASLQRFANIRAQRDAEDRAAKTLAEQIRAQIASYIATAGS